MVEEAHLYWLQMGGRVPVALEVELESWVAPTETTQGEAPGKMVERAFFPEASQLGFPSPGAPILQLITRFKIYKLITAYLGHRRQRRGRHQWHQSFGTQRWFYQRIAWRSHHQCSYQHRTGWARAIPRTY